VSRRRDQNLKGNRDRDQTEYTVSIMFFMVIEAFKNGDPKSVGERFRQCGRMLPEGVIYHASWIDSENARCFQIMEAPDRKLLNPWIAAWNDLVDFEVVPVQTSADFWAAVQSQTHL
jgi:hypothetical protein